MSLVKPLDNVETFQRDHSRFVVCTTRYRVTPVTWRTCADVEGIKPGGGQDKRVEFNAPPDKYRSFRRRELRDGNMKDNARCYFLSSYIACRLPAADPQASPAGSQL